MKAGRTDSCIFCGQPANSDEDVFPKWLLKIVGLQPLKVTRGGPDPRQTRAKSLKLKARIVCRTCNNGWMSGLENAVLPHLGAMLKGERIGLETDAQVSLAKWAVKTSMVAEHTLGRPSSDLYWTPAERHSFSLPPHDIPGVTDVLLGHYTGSEWRALLTGGTTKIKPLASAEPVAPMIRSIIACQPVLLLVESDRYEETTGRKGWVWPLRHYDRLVQLHRQMFRVISWPSPRPLSPDEFDEFAGKKSPAGPAPLDVIDLHSGPGSDPRSSADD